jgi:hypothetical protein
MSTPVHAKSWRNLIILIQSDKPLQGSIRVTKTESNWHNSISPSILDALPTGVDMLTDCLVTEPGMDSLYQTVTPSRKSIDRGWLISIRLLWIKCSINHAIYSIYHDPDQFILTASNKNNHNRTRIDTNRLRFIQHWSLSNWEELRRIAHRFTVIPYNYKLLITLHWFRLQSAGLVNVWLALIL